MYVFFVFIFLFIFFLFHSPSFSRTRVRKTVIIYVLIPVPWLFFSYQNDEDAECSDLVNQFGFCTSGMIFSSLFGLPLLVMYQEGGDDGWYDRMTILNLSILISITFIIYLVSKGDD